LVLELRERVLSLGGVEERSLHGAFCHEWTPAYYKDGVQLCHVRNFRAGLRVTFFVGASTCEPFVLASSAVSLETRRLVAETPAPRNAKELRLPLASPADVGRAMELVSAKWDYVVNRPWVAPRRS